MAWHSIVSLLMRLPRLLCSQPPSCHLPLPGECVESDFSFPRPPPAGLEIEDDASKALATRLSGTGSEGGGTRDAGDRILPRRWAVRSESLRARMIVSIGSYKDKNIYTPSDQPSRNVAETLPKHKSSNPSSLLKSAIQRTFPATSPQHFKDIE
ncbi:hypothetical protein B0H16DRAFT_1461966 [Mycena metata]|uniref:Uncharacterized protein n=1 Tax=Mycena metata TaxID=1033252 RepID=A0AAD7IRT2_9AGAR|nr:hypothetical protein B0H16DRAFT_1461966 [Mycena metata]